MYVCASCWPGNILAHLSKINSTWHASPSHWLIPNKQLVHFNVFVRRIFVKFNKDWRKTWGGWETGSNLCASDLYVIVEGWHDKLWSNIRFDTMVLNMLQYFLKISEDYGFITYIHNSISLFGFSLEPSQKLEYVMLLLILRASGIVHVWRKQHAPTRPTSRLGSFILRQLMEHVACECWKYKYDTAYRAKILKLSYTIWSSESIEPTHSCYTYATLI